MTEPAHYPLAPSSAYRWLVCPGSARQDPPSWWEEDTTEADKGTLGHKIAESFVDRQGICVDLDPPDRDFLDSLDQDDREFLLREGVLAGQFVLDLARKMGVTPILERRIKSEVVPDHGGTADVILYDGDLLHLVDYKFGRNFVSERDNPQLMSYLNLARQIFPLAAKFRVTIIQPRMGPPRTADYTLEQLEDHAFRVQMAGLSDDFEAGDHCVHCPLLTMCPTFAAYLKQALEEFPTLDADLNVINPSEPTPQEVDRIVKIYQLGKLADAAKASAATLLKKWRGKLNEDHGVQIRESARRVWDPDLLDCVKEVALTHEVCLMKEKPAFTPSQLQKKLDLTDETFADLFGKFIKTAPVQTIVSESLDLSEFDDLTSSDP